MAEGYEYTGGSYNLLPDGDYEVKIEEMGRKITPNGKEKLQIKYRIRDDIEGQEYGNRCIFEDIWKEKDSPEHFNRKRINQLLGTQNVKSGAVFNTIEDIIDYLMGNNCLILHIITVFDEYRGEDVNKVSYYKSSKHKPEKVAYYAPPSDEDLPF